MSIEPPAPSFRTIPQAKPCQCAVTAWEYATGIPRATIADQLGHDGCTRTTDSAMRMAERKTTHADLLGFTGICDEEMLWWAYRNGVRVATITPKEVLLLKIREERHHDKLHAPSCTELVAELTGKVAVLSIVLDLGKGIAHSIAWIDRYALNPSVPALMQPMDLDPCQIRVAHILPDFSAASRIRALTDHQPGEL